MTECIDTDGCIYCGGCLDDDEYGCCMGQKSYKLTEFNSCCGSTPFSGGTGKCCGFPGTVVSKSTCCTNNQIGVCPDGQECNTAGACEDKCTEANCATLAKCARCGTGPCYATTNPAVTCCGNSIIDTVAYPDVKCCGGTTPYSEMGQCCDPATGSSTCASGLECDATKTPATCKVPCDDGTFCNGECCATGKKCMEDPTGKYPDQCAPNNACEFPNIVCAVGAEYCEDGRCGSCCFGADGCPGKTLSECTYPCFWSNAPEECRQG